MKIYSWEDAKRKVSCLRYLSDRGIPVRNGRCAATWRGGTNAESVHVEESQWFDFALKQGGSVVDLCAVVECNGDRLRALQVMGERYGIEVVSKTRKTFKTRSQMLLSSGYACTATYPYCTADGAPVYFVDRYEKEGEKKEFVQRTTEHEGLDPDTPKLLYNLPAVVKAREVFVVEGEKDVETMRRFGLVATTNSGGGGYWEDSFNQYFADRDVVIVSDNDATGQKHGQGVYSCLKPVAKSVRLLTISTLPKGDFTDWVEKEGGTLELFRDAISAAKEVEADTPIVAKAKLANERPFSNFREVAGKKGHPEHVMVPINELITEVHTRFLGFPRVLGEILFDWDKDKQAVRYLTSREELFAWIQRISRNNAEWTSETGAVSRAELFCALQQSSIRYSGISNAPHYPVRKDIFYTHAPLPPPDPTHTVFWELVKFFNPANAANRLLLAAFFIAPMFYDGRNDRPLWIIDTDDAQASGKTAIVKANAYLYSSEPLSIEMAQLERDSTQVKKRMLSTVGRLKRIVLFDNVTKSVRSASLAVLITENFITGLAPYGRTEESRPNDMTYCITVNGARVDTDIASRSYTVRIRAPRKQDSMWANHLYGFIDKNRSQIFADIIHMMQNVKVKAQRRKSRFGVFDQTVLAAVCADEEEFAAVDRTICGENERANEDQDRAMEFLDIIAEKVAMSEKGGVRVDTPMIFRNQDIDWVLSKSDGELQDWKVGQVRQLIKQGQLPDFSKDFDRIPPRKDVPQYRGLFYGMNLMPDEGDLTEAQVLVRGDRETPFKNVKTIIMKKELVLCPVQS